MRLLGSVFLNWRGALSPQAAANAISGARGDPQLRILEKELDSLQITQLSVAIDQYRQAQDQPELLEGPKQAVAAAVQGLSPTLWRSAIEPLLEGRDRKILFLADVFQCLRSIAGSRPYTTGCPANDKDYFRAVIGGLNLFLDGVDAQEDRLIAGMVEEVASQIQDAALVVCADRAGVIFPPSPSAVIVPVIPPGPREAQLSLNFEGVPKTISSISDAEWVRLAEAPFKDLDPEKFTPLGQVFIHLVGQHRPKLTGKSHIFMIYVQWLVSLYKYYWNERLKTGGDFQGAYEVVFRNSRYKDVARYKERYGRLFAELLRFLEAHQDLADLVHASLAAGETRIMKGEHRVVPTAGGPPADGVKRRSPPPPRPEAGVARDADLDLPEVPPDLEEADIIEPDGSGSVPPPPDAVFDPEPPFPNDIPSALTPIPPALTGWDPQGVDWEEIMRSRRISPKEVWGTIGTIFPDYQPAGPLGYATLEPLIGKLKEVIEGPLGAIEAARDSFSQVVELFPDEQQISKWRERGGALETSLMEAFDRSPTEEEGREKIARLPSLLQEVRGLIGEIQRKAAGIETSLRKPVSREGHSGGGNGDQDVASLVTNAVGGDREAISELEKIGTRLAREVRDPKLLKGLIALADEDREFAKRALRAVGSEHLKPYIINLRDKPEDVPTYQLLRDLSVHNKEVRGVILPQYGEGVSQKPTPESLIGLCRVAFDDESIPKGMQEVAKGRLVEIVQQNRTAVRMLVEAVGRLEDQDERLKVAIVDCLRGVDVTRTAYRSDEATLSLLAGDEIQNPAAEGALRGLERRKREEEYDRGQDDLLRQKRGGDNAFAPKITPIDDPSLKPIREELAAFFGGAEETMESLNGIRDRVNSLSPEGRLGVAFWVVEGLSSVDLDTKQAVNYVWALAQLWQRMDERSQRFLKVTVLRTIRGIFEKGYAIFRSDLTGLAQAAMGASRGGPLAVGIKDLKGRVQERGPDAFFEILRTCPEVEPVFDVLLVCVILKLDNDQVSDAMARWFALRDVRSLIREREYLSPKFVGSLEGMSGAEGSLLYKPLEDSLAKVHRDDLGRLADLYLPDFIKACKQMFKTGHGRYRLVAHLNVLRRIFSRMEGGKQKYRERLGAISEVNEASIDLEGTLVPLLTNLF